MPEAIAIVLFLTTLCLAALILFQAYRGRVNLLSIRNFFLLGMVFFQLRSAQKSLWSGDYGEFGNPDPSRAALVFGVVAVLFLLTLLTAYRLAGPVRAFARRVPVFNAPSGAGTMLTLSVAFLIAGAVARVVLTQIPVLGVLMMIVSNGLLAVAAGMAVWAWVPRLFNPAVALVAGPVMLVSMATVTYGTFGRRDLLNVVLACGWAAYHSWWKYKSFGGQMARFAVVGSMALVLLAGFTATRGNAGETRSPMQVVMDIAGADIGRGVASMTAAQDTGGLSLWICATRPASIPYDTLHQARYFFTQPIPRVIFPGKPDALGRVMVDQRRLEGRGDNFTVGPGLIGHIVNDNPWISLVVYAVGLGMIFRFMDELVARHGLNPFLVLPVGVSLGEWVGLARGESGLFLSTAMLSTTGTFIAMAACAAVLSRFGVRLEYLPPEPEPEEYGEYEEGEDDPAYAPATAGSY